jgi:hypothetical protein
VVFGHRNKLTAEGPFLDLLRAFRRELTSVQIVTVVGYSFGDVHINEYLSQWLNSRSENRLRIVSPSFSNNRNDYAGLLRMWAKNRLDVLSEPASSGLARAYGVFSSDIAS